MTEEQAKHVYKKVETDSVINTETLQQEIEQDQELHRLDDYSRDDSPNRELIINTTEKIDTVKLQMEQWSILSNAVKYIQYDRCLKNFHNLDIEAINRNSHHRKSGDKENQMPETDFGDTPEKLKTEYLDVYEGIQSEILNTTRFDMNSDLNTTYLRRIDTTRSNKLMQENLSQFQNRGIQ